MKVISTPFPSIGMMAARASELGLSYGMYSSGPQYIADLENGYYEKHYTRSGKRKAVGNNADRKGASESADKGTNKADSDILPVDYKCGIT